LLYTLSDGALLFVATLAYKFGCGLLVLIHQTQTETQTRTMETATKQSITVQATVDAPVEKTWKYFTEPDHITKWSFASDDWHAPRAENDLRKGGRFLTALAAKDGSFAFDFGGSYDNVVKHKEIQYTIDDGRKVKVIFESKGNATVVTETFEAESQNPIEMQRAGWQAFLDNFKKHVERS
jgi:uncharacterized protein YndB with AHSA1/START domain